MPVHLRGCLCECMARHESRQGVLGAETVRCPSTCTVMVLSTWRGVQLLQGVSGADRDPDLAALYAKDNLSRHVSCPLPLHHMPLDDPMSCVRV